jgi:alpha-N-arabinofuranosidase
MTFLVRALAAASCIASVVAVDVVVQSSGGNVTGKFGHPYGYGFLHEVGFEIHLQVHVFNIG